MASPSTEPTSVTSPSTRPSFSSSNNESPSSPNRSAQYHRAHPLSPSAAIFGCFLFCPHRRHAWHPSPTKTKEASLTAALFLSSSAAIPGRSFLTYPSTAKFGCLLSVFASSQVWLPYHHSSSQMALRRGAPASVGPPLPLLPP